MQESCFEDILDQSYHNQTVWFRKGTTLEGLHNRLNAEN